ncbi:MFS transporter, partial [Klebsiella quasipneumoniae]|uniref:MFS transporter n=2 Tax=Klebsiella quasipneumoniae TaxID=1463165 RepID=UPI002152466C
QTETEATGAPQKHHYTLNQQVGSITAIINAIMGLFFKIGFTIGGAIPLWLLAVYGFNESGAVQSASAIDGIIMTAVWIPIALAAISMVIMQVYPISDKHVTDINRQLDEIRV